MKEAEKKLEEKSFLLVNMLNGGGGGALREVYL